MSPVLHLAPARCPVGLRASRVCARDEISGIPALVAPASRSA